MNGILEQLIAALNANTAAIQAQSGMAQTLAGSTAQLNAPQQTQQQPVPQQVIPQQTAQNIGEPEVMALITPHLGNDTIKAALGTAMRAMGINALPEILPHQFGAVYAAFQQVIAQHTGAQQPQQTQAASII